MNKRMIISVVYTSLKWSTPCTGSLTDDGRLILMTNVVRKPPKKKEKRNKEKADGQTEKQGGQQKLF